MKATMRFSYKGVNYDKGDDVALTDKSEVEYLTGKKLISGTTPSNLTDEAHSLTQDELAALNKAPAEKRKMTQPVTEKKEIAKP